MVTYLEEIKELEKELSTTKYNKKTQHHIGLVKAKIARLKQCPRGPVMPEYAEAVLGVEFAIALCPVANVPPRSTLALLFMT